MIEIKTFRNVWVDYGETPAQLFRRSGFSAQALEDIDFSIKNSNIPFSGNRGREKIVASILKIKDSELINTNLLTAKIAELGYKPAGLPEILSLVTNVLEIGHERTVALGLSWNFKYSARKRFLFIFLNCERYDIGVAPEPAFWAGSGYIPKLRLANRVPRNDFFVFLGFSAM